MKLRASMIFPANMAIQGWSRPWQAGRDVGERKTGHHEQHSDRI
jgi:hypothetical protein